MNDEASYERQLVSGLSEKLNDKYKHANHLMLRK